MGLQWPNMSPYGPVWVLCFAVFCCAVGCGTIKLCRTRLSLCNMEGYGPNVCKN